MSNSDDSKLPPGGLALWMEAAKRISPLDDFKNLGNVPCARNSLLSGIASGIGFGAIRATTAGPAVAVRWAAGTFMVVSLGTWSFCRRARRDEAQRMQTVMESLPKHRRARPSMSFEETVPVNTKQ